ncbi:MAG: diaminopimelate decarboxylase [Chthoniobacterales bacterium]
MHFFSYTDGSLFCEKVALNLIANEVGTPAYVYSANTIRKNYQALDTALSGLDHHICFAVKANSNISILKLLADAGSGFDIVSGGELYRVLQAGGKGSDCTFAGVGKTVSEIEYALENDIYSFNVESEAELERINSVAGRMGKTAPIAVRVNPDVDAQTHAFISTGKSKNKFGIGIDRAFEVYARAAELPNLKIRGVQSHIGSQILSSKPFREAAEKLAALVQKLHEKYALEFFSFGGGVGIVYENSLASGPAEWWSQPEIKALKPSDYAEAIQSLFAPLGLRILFEPGRFLVGNAGVLLSEVQYVKQTPAKRFTIVDAAMNDLIRPALYEGHHDIHPLREPTKNELLTTDIVGPVCESGDFFAQNRELPQLEQGDRIALMSAGAYGFVMASNYNSRPFLPEVLVSEDRWEIIRERQSYEDLIAGERLLSLE